MWSEKYLHLGDLLVKYFISYFSNGARWQEAPSRHHMLQILLKVWKFGCRWRGSRICPDVQPQPCSQYRSGQKRSAFPATGRFALHYLLRKQVFLGAREDVATLPKTYHLLPLKFRFRKAAKRLVKSCYLPWLPFLHCCGTWGTRRWLWSKHLGTHGKGGKQGASKEYAWQERKELAL